MQVVAEVPTQVADDPLTWQVVPVGQLTDEQSSPLLTQDTPVSVTLHTEPAPQSTLLHAVEVVLHVATLFTTPQV